MKGILSIIGILVLTFVVIPWIGILILDCIKAFLKDNDKFDG